MITETANLSITSSDSQAISGSCTEVGSAEQTINQSYGSATADASLAVAFTVAGLQSIFLVSDQDLTIKTNSATTPDKTIPLVAGRPFTWRKSDGYFANPFATDVARFYVSCTPAAKLKGKVLVA